MAGLPKLKFNGDRSCGDCKHSRDYISYCAAKNGCTVKCLKHKRRVYAFAFCDDHEFDNKPKHKED